MAAASDIQSVFIKLRKSLERAVIGIVPPKEVEDIVQETYVRVCQIERKDRILEPRSFLFKTAHNLALDYVKRAESRLVVSVEDYRESEPLGPDRTTDDTFDKVSTNEEFYQFCEAVRLLPVQCRRAFVLKKVYGYTQREIAKEMTISESTVEKHIAEGIKRCNYFMIQHGVRRGDGSNFEEQKNSRRKSRRDLKDR